MDLAQVPGSGSAGRITKGDIVAHLEQVRSLSLQLRSHQLPLYRPSLWRLNRCRANWCR